MYRRITTYIYSYENGQKICSCGYCRFDIGDNQCKIFINVKVPDRYTMGIAEIYLLAQDETGKRITKEMLGKTGGLNGSICYRQICEREHMAGNIGMDNIKGVLIYNGENLKKAFYCNLKGDEPNILSLEEQDRDMDIYDNNNEVEDCSDDMYEYNSYNYTNKEDAGINNADEDNININNIDVSKTNINNTGRINAGSNDTSNINAASNNTGNINVASNNAASNNAERNDTDSIDKAGSNTGNDSADRDSADRDSADRDSTEIRSRTSGSSKGTDIRTDNKPDCNDCEHNTAINNNAPFNNSDTGNALLEKQIEYTDIVDWEHNGMAKENEKNNENSINQEDKWQELLFSKFPKVRISFGGEESEAIKMRPHDLVWFPRKYWRFSNNRCLLNGYYNYRYIMLVKGIGDREGNYYLAVPGKNMVNEAISARKQGFTEFVRSKGDLGFWCCKVGQ